MAPFVTAQALIEKGALDSAISGVSNFLTRVEVAVVDRPYLLVVLVVILVLLLKKRR